MIEVNESYFVPRRVRGKRRRGVVNKIPVFGILKIEGRDLIRVITKASRVGLIPIHQRNTANSDTWKSYDGHLS